MFTIHFVKTCDYNLYARGRYSIVRQQIGTKSRWRCCFTGVTKVVTVLVKCLVTTSAVKRVNAGNLFY